MTKSKLKTDNPFGQLCRILSNIDDETDHSTISWDAITALAARHRVQPLLLNALQEKKLPIPDNHQIQLVSAQRENTFSGLKITRAAVVVNNAFQKQGIGLCFFKGITLNFLAPDRFTFRHNGDLDALLVDPAKVREADQLLCQIGFTRMGFSPISKMSEYQVQLLLKYEKDLGYYSSTLGVKLELHLRLFVNDTLLKLPNSEIFSNSIQNTNACWKNIPARHELAPS